MSERTVSLNDFDINLLETLLKRFLNLESDVQMWLSTIREIRNCIAHATSTTVFYPGRLDKWWMKLEGSILGLVTKIPPAFYAKSIESQINVLKNSNLEAIYGKQLMEDVNAENKILLEDLAARSDTRIVECENNIRQAIIESNNDFKRQIAKVKGEFMRKFEELEAIIKGSAKQNPNVRSEHDSVRKVHVACQVEGDDIDELLTIKNLSDPDIVTANESDDKGFKMVDVKQKCILLELTASSEILSSEECLLNAIDQLINQLILAGNLNTRVQGKMTLNVTFTSPLSREELDVFSRVFCTSEIIDSDIINPTQDYSIGTVTRETQTGIGLKSRVLEQIQDGGILLADFDELGRKMSSYLLQSSSDNTNNKYFNAYKRCERFILKQGGISLPAKPIYVALYLTILIDKCSSYSVVQSAYSSLHG